MNASSARFAPRWTRLWLAFGWLGLGLVSAILPVAAAAQPRQQVPQHWISYATLASNQLQASLGDLANDAVVRLHASMQSRMRQDGRASPPASVVVRVWVASSGRVERVGFDSLGDAQADADLRALLTARPLAEPPPRDMRQPMVLQLTLSSVTSS
ncbi:YbaB/EbfC family DNA-binding protein [Variovorax sp. Root473]|uniref:YbaB/EbfC family DNA-binding protein n=1 Tax=Variovorax sp. Root473 TaxID=1736541 RepID=UPI000ACEB9F4|nr:YbaB/EbfC family DNA-binding protein [Variovorax sp. Root473]